MIACAGTAVATPATLSVEPAGEKILYYITPYATEIADAITETASQLAQQMRKDNKAAAELEAEGKLESDHRKELAHAEMEKRLLDFDALQHNEEDVAGINVLVLKGAAVRFSPALGSMEVGKLKKGTVVAVLETTLVSTLVDQEAGADDDDTEEERPGIVRVRFEFGDLLGWIRCGMPLLTDLK